MSYLDSSHKNAYIALKDRLAEATASLSPSLSLREDGTFPLLMFESGLEVAGFGVLSGNIETEYKSSYNEFRKTYSANRNKWSHSNVSFVVCRPDELLASDEFLNKIESDIYFCRKYVISLGTRLAHEIERLPFVPLDRTSIAVPRRPVSAHVLLRNLGASAELSKSISAPGHKKGTKIAEECVSSDSFECRGQLDDASIYQRGVNESKSSSRVKSITINDFRAYRGKHEFNLDGDLIILYGPNGLGKTSFFDAVDFVSTAGCGRFSDIGGDDYFLKNAPHLDSDPQHSFVELEVTVGSEVKKFARHVSNAKKVSVNGTLKERTPALFELTGLGEHEFEKRIETITNLFRATHLFGQDFQTLTDGFGKTSELSIDIVSRMLAFQDYARSDQKIGEILQALQTEKKQTSDSQSVYRQRLEEINSELGKFQNITASLTTPESLNDWIENLIKIIGAKVVLPKRDENETLKEFTRSIRSVIEARLTQHTERLNTLALALNDLDDINKARTELKQIEQRIEAIVKEIEENQRGSQDVRLSISESEKKLADTKSREASDRKLLENLVWLKQVIGRISILRKSLQEGIQSRTAIESDLSSIEDVLNTQEPSLSLKKTDADSYLKECEGLRSSIEEISRIRDGYNAYLSSLKEVTDCNLRQAIIEKDEQETLLRVDHEKRQLNLRVADRDKLAGERNVLLKRESEISTLIENLKGHVRDGHCPACGVDHGAKDKVLALLSSHSSSQSQELFEKTERLQEVNAEIERVERLISDETSKQKMLSGERLQLQKHLSEIKELQQLFEQDLLKIGLSVGIDDLKDRLANLLATKQKTLSDLQLQIAAKNVDIASDAAALSATRARRDALKKETDELSVKIAALERDVQDKLSEAAARGFNPDQIGPNIEAGILDVEKRLAEVRDEVGEKEAMLGDLRLKESVLVEKLSLANHQKEISTKEKLKIQKSIDAFGARLRSISVATDAAFDELVSKKQDYEVLLTECRDLLSQISTAETAIDSSELSAERSRLSAELKKVEGEISSLEKKEGRIAGWIGTFTKVRAFLTKVRDSSISEYTTKYGPLVSTVQSRMRSVYGFGEIALSSTEGKIAVTVKRSETQLRPIDYFSESQKQILVLSIFLASALTQNWSSFSPIFLDDPVTHFDDLNAYAFLDLIAGMLHSERGRRQFVISTCEEKLFQLMRQKFYGYGKRVLIYEFSAIGENGPVWRQIENGSAQGLVH